MDSIVELDCSRVTLSLGLVGPFAAGTMFRTAELAVTLMVLRAV
jgi:hypothetical protein